MLLRGVAILHLTLTIKAATSSCPHLCSCSQDTVICTGQGLLRIPSRIPPDTVRLDLQENKISEIRKNDLKALRRLKILQLMDNQIHMIESGAFDNLIALERLRLNRNRLRTLPDKIFINNVNLHRLDLSGNLLTVLTDAQLQGPKSVRNLQFDRNFLTCLDSHVIATWTEMEILTLSGNNLSTMGQLGPMPNLRILRLAENPWLCDCRLRWMKKIISNSHLLARNTLCHRPAHLNSRMLENINETLMKCSGIEKRAATSCRDASVCPSVCTCTETTIDCRDRGLTHIPANLPSTTTELRLEQNQITYVPPRAFHNLHQLKRLDLSKNNIGNIGPRAFDGLKSLNSLVLYGNNISNLPSEAFHGLSNLQLLLLNANKLQCLRRDTFSNLTNLNLLSLYDNQIHSIANGTFDGLINLTTLHLARNPIICDCNLEWLAHLLAKKAIETSSARCDSPKRVAHRRISTLHHSKFRCKGSEAYITANAGRCIIDHPCPVGCLCLNTFVDCSNQGWTDFPRKIPRYTTELRMSNNKIVAIRLSTNLHFENLTTLLLDGNEIEFIDSDSLSALGKIQELDLSRNKLQHFSPRVFGSGNLQITKLNLSHNQIKCFSVDSLAQLATLKSVSLDGNDFICNCHIVDFVYDLRMNGSHLLNSAVCHEPLQLRGRTMASLTRDELFCTEVTEDTCAEDDNYCPADCKCHETVVRCSNKNLKKFPVGIPAKTTELLLDSNDIVYIPPELNKLKHLVKLALGSNSLYCDCRIAWFSRWIKRRFIEAGIARCELPLNLRNQLLLSANELQFKCTEKVPRNVLIKCDACIDSPCKNGGTCQRMKGRTFACKCAARYHGKYCQNKIDACYGEPCLNNATCKILQDGRFKCHCVKGFEGDHCETNIDDCTFNKCQNGATCIDLINSYECKCPVTHIGRFCEVKMEFCSNKMNPCENKGVCVRQALSYRCNCLPGFTGTNCTINIDDCEHNLCKNGAICVDGIQSYKCECISGYTGRFCELSPMSSNYYPNTSPCHAHSCEHGVCHELGSDVFCKCSEGYTGKRCEQLRAAGYVHDDSFIALEPFSASPDGNLTFTLITTASIGVVMYYGDNAHLSIELYNGRLKISFCVGNFPASHMYSYVTVHDGRPHRIEIYIKGITLTLKIDNHEPQTIVNSGPEEAFILISKNFLYVGGIPTSVAIKAITAFHLKQPHSFKGCISDFYVNGVVVDFDKAEQKERVLNGCFKSVDLCSGVQCYSGTCTTNSSLSNGYICHCPPGYSGTHCQRREIFCAKEKFHYHHVEGNCRSTEQIKNSRCYGWCGSDSKQCCTVVKSKRRRLKMHCRDGSTTSQIVRIVRKCQCTAEAACRAT
uniref:Uncharacterized protein n=1 Tax=Brugia malayi TaxID=6279 RepID=A0A8L7YLJ6_BRUMA